MAEVVVDAKSTNRGSAWSVETNPKYARAWLESLSPLSNLDSARELYQGLCALNRVELDPAQRYELMQLYQAPVREACETVQSTFHRVSFPMSGKLRRLAGFVCQLHMEMARGYMLCLLSLSKTWLMPWRRRQVLVLPAERALHHLAEVLTVSYQLYLPYPADVWRNAHAAYGLVELHGRHKEQIEADEGKEMVKISVSQRYRRLLLLGAANPYQMPFGECIIVNRFLGRWIDQVSIGASPPQGDAAAGFLVDLSMDVPPVAFGRTPNTDNPNLRWLDITEFTRTLHGMLRRLEKGETANSLQLGVEGLDSACYDMLQRLHRVYGQAVSRRHSRIKRHETVVICAGIGALHFFASGQKLFVPTGQEAPKDAAIDTRAEGGAAYISLDEPEKAKSLPRPTTESFRVDRWHVKDVCPQGLMIAQEKENESSVRFRVGDVLGVQRVNAPGHWSVGVVRWFKAYGESGTEVGVELIAPDVTPASVRLIGDGEASKPALMLPAVEVTQTLASVIIARGTVQIGNDCFIAGADGLTRRVRVLEVLEHTNAIEQIVIGDVV